VDAAVMLDVNGFVSETNDTNVFLVRDGKLLTPSADSCLPGLTRRMILDIAAREEIFAREKNLSMSEVYSADEVFTTGTMGELTPILLADGRSIGNGGCGEMTKRLQQLHRQYAYETGERIPD
jgi:branched-subunit amino acid aminotransferase/4-amino-4-deoxychorismate lyase